MKVYLVCSDFEGRLLYKIGITKRDIDKRIKEFKTGNFSHIYLIDHFESKWSSKIESRLHKIYEHKCVSGEWFDLNDSDIFNFKSICNDIHNNLELITMNNTYYQDTGRLF